MCSALSATCGAIEITAITITIRLNIHAITGIHCRLRLIIADCRGPDQYVWNIGNGRWCICSWRTMIHCLCSWCCLVTHWWSMCTPCSASRSTGLCRHYVQGTCEKDENRTNKSRTNKATSEHIKGSKERYLLGQNTTCESGGNRVSSYKTTLRQQ